MSFDPKEFLRVARYVLDSATRGEAEARTVVGRAYYASFLVVRERLAERGLIALTGTGADHRIVARVLQRERPELGDILRTLRDQRNRADYDLTVEVTVPFAAQSVELAENLIKDLQS